MKSVMFSEIVQAPRGAGLLRGLSPLTAYGLTVAIGMPLLVLALRALDPGAPLAFIVLPMLAGLALPLWLGTPGRLEVGTRFDAAHMRPALDTALSALGYAATGSRQGQLRYVKSTGNGWQARSHAVSIRIDAHRFDVIGPIPTLRALQRALSGEALLSSRETVAGAMQISDNAERVAGMAE